MSVDRGMGASAAEVRSRRRTVLIAEQHPVLRGVIRMACDASETLSVAGEAADGREAASAAEALAPDVVVLDLELPGLDGLEVARRIRSEGGKARILLLTSRADDRTIFRAIRAGVDGYLEKSSGMRSIAEALERVAAGERAYTPEQDHAALAELGRMARQARESTRLSASVTAREIEILRFASRGLTVRQIATRLGLSPRTVEAHVGKLYRKLQVTNRVQAIGRAVHLGLIDLSDWTAEQGSAPGAARR